MTEAENRIREIEKMAAGNEPDNRLAEVHAICELARAVHRLGDLYLTDLIFQNRIPADGEQLEVEGPDYRPPAAKAARTFLRRVYNDGNDVRSK